MSTKSLIVTNANITVTYSENSDGSLYLSSVVTQGNFVEKYNNKYFSSLDELKDFLKTTYREYFF